MKLSRRNMVAGMISVPAAGLMGGRAFGQETINLTMASSHPTTLPWITPLHTVVVAKSNAMLEARGSKYRINWTESYGGALYGYTETLEAVTQQITDMGWIGALFEPTALPLQNIMYSAPFVIQTVQQAINTVNKMNETEAAMKKEWADHNISYFGSCVSDGYDLLTKKPIEKLSDLEGLKLVGPISAASWIEPLGATLVGTAMPAIYGQLQTGVGDGTLLIGTAAFSLKLHEQAPFVTKVNTGPLTFGGFGINSDVYKGLPQDVQQVLAELGKEYSLENARIIESQLTSLYDRFAAGGATVSEMPASQKLEWVNRLPDLGKAWVESLEARGVTAREILARFIETARSEGAVPLRDWSANV